MYCSPSRPLVSPDTRTPEAGEPLRRCLTIPEYAELVALWISQHDPRNFALTEVNPGCAESDESLNLGVLIVSAEVEMKAVLDLLAFVDRLEDEPRDMICLWPNLERAR